MAGAIGKDGQRAGGGGPRFCMSAVYMPQAVVGRRPSTLQGGGGTKRGLGSIPDDLIRRFPDAPNLDMEEAPPMP